MAIRNCTVFLAVSVFCFSALGHGGGVDAKGCHRDSSTGTRHCHKRKVGEVLSGRVVRVSDGDTLRLRTGDKTAKVRLSGIDCPEKRQRHGPEAKQALASLVDGQHVRIEQTAKDRYGRVVGRVYLGELNVNRQLVADGHCWAYRRYLKDKTLISLEKSAKADRRGLWADPSPTPPWQWRRQSR